MNEPALDFATYLRLRRDLAEKYPACDGLLRGFDNEHEARGGHGSDASINDLGDRIDEFFGKRGAS